MSTLKEQLEKLTDLKHRRAVWQAVYEFLDENFISKGVTPAKAIRVSDCVVEIVPEEVVEDILKRIGEDAITEIEAEIEAIENAQVVVIDGEAKAQA